MQLTIRNITVFSVLVSFVIVILSFPNFNLSISPGLDSSYTWGLNYLFENDSNKLKELVYPIGPLAFLKMPSTLGNTFLYATLFHSIVKFCIAFITIKHFSKKKLSSLFIHSFFALCLVLFSGFDVAIILLSLLLALLFLKKEKTISLVFLVILSIIGFAIKTSIGISCFSIVFLGLLSHLFLFKNYKKTLLFTGISTAIGSFLGSIIYGGFGLFFTQLFHGMKVSGGYSSSLSLHPDNNWWALAGFWIIIGSLPIILRQKKLFVLYILSSACFFMMWKHAMVREDASHNGILLYFTGCFFLLSMLVSNKKWLVGLFAAASLFLYHRNLKTIYGFNGINISLNGFENLEKFINYSNTLEKNKEESKQNLSPLTLDEKWKEKIGDSTIDFYPWEHSIAKANKLNWHPRKTIEIGASSSNWSSIIAASHYNYDKSPQYILYHYYPDRYEGKLGSIDNRYILNDEPLVWENILKNYYISLKNKRHVLFEKLDKTNLIHTQEYEKKEVKLNTWFPVPKTNFNEYMLCEIDVNNTVLQKAQTFLYKDDLYLIDYKLKDGRVLTYRFMPNTATEGVWCNPLFQDFTSKPTSNIVEKIRIRKIYYSRKSGNVFIQFLKKKFIPKGENFAKLPFGKSVTLAIKPIFSEIQNFESLDPNSFSRSDISFEGNFSNELQKDQFSFTYRISLDSIWKKTDSSIHELQVRVQTLYQNKSKNSDLIIEVKNSKKDFWESSQFEISENWNYKYVPKTITRNYHSSGELIIYAWNKEENPLRIDDFEVVITEP